LIERIGRATAQETASTGFNWAFGPTLAVPQDIRWGRAYEGYGQDPALVASYAGAMVRACKARFRMAMSPPRSSISWAMAARRMAWTKATPWPQRPS
jgi:beta-glucosidase-like glycosyl hydrolase